MAPPHPNSKVKTAFTRAKDNKAGVAEGLHDWSGKLSHNRYTQLLLGTIVSMVQSKTVYVTPNL